MGYIEKRTGHYRARYRDSLGRQRSETFTRKADAERYLREVQVEMDRGRWLDPQRRRQVRPAPLRRLPHRPAARR
jgi:hypothetical protein